MSATIPDTVPLSVLLQSLYDRLMHATSSQIGLLLKIERAVAARRSQIEQSCAATVLAPRPLAGESHPREPAPLPPPPPARPRAAGGEAIVSTRQAMVDEGAVWPLVQLCVDDGATLRATMDMRLIGYAAGALARPRSRESFALSARTGFWWLSQPIRASCG